MNDHKPLSDAVRDMPVMTRVIRSGNLCVNEISTAMSNMRSAMDNDLLCKPQRPNRESDMNDPTDRSYTIKPRQETHNDY